jgi:hypothetical protein
VGTARAASKVSPDGAAHSVVTRRVVLTAAAVSEGFDPFDEPFPDVEASAPVSATSADEPFDPFETEEAQSLVAPPDGQEEADAEAAAGAAARAFDVESAFDEPERLAAVPGIEAEVELGRDAVEDETVGGDSEADVDNEVGIPEPFESADEEESAEPGIEEEFSEPEDAGIDEEDLEELLRRAEEGGFDIRPMERAPLTPEAQAELRRQLEQERLQNEQECEQFYASVKADNIRTVNLDIRMQGEPGEDYPFSCGLGDELFESRNWPQITYLWKAAGLCHKPLYFEQVQVERYGHSWHPLLQPVMSGAHFFGSAALLPYKMGLEAPNECIYTLGYYRPGSCAPYMIEAMPFTWRAALYEGGAIAGGILLFP